MPRKCGAQCHKNGGGLNGRRGGIRGGGRLTGRGQLGGPLGGVRAALSEGARAQLVAQVACAERVAGNELRHRGALRWPERCAEGDDERAGAVDERGFQWGAVHVITRGCTGRQCDELYAAVCVVHVAVLQAALERRWEEERARTGAAAEARDVLRVQAGRAEPEVLHGVAACVRFQFRG